MLGKRVCLKGVTHVTVEQEKTILISNVVLCDRYIHNEFADFAEVTVGASCSKKHLNIGFQNHSQYLGHGGTGLVFPRQFCFKSICFQFHNQERFNSFTQLYYRNADGAILVYDITDFKSFEKVKLWAAELHKNCGPDMDVVCD